jgi:hypothetical protein
MVAMSMPVVVIHGIAIRNPGKFLRTVDGLDVVLGDGYELIPVFWGDLGASDRYIDKVVARHPDKSRNMHGMVADGLAAAVTSGLGHTLSWWSRQRGDPDAAEQIDRRTDKLNDDLRGRVRGYVNGKFQDMRIALTSALLPFLADVISYQSHGRREQVHARMRSVIDKELGPEYGTAQKPVTVLAHSLGGVISFDMATAQDVPLYIDHFITLGSQPAFFHLMDPRSSEVPEFEGEPVTLPETIRRWTNIWDELDLLAFGVGDVFRLHDGTAPIDRPVRCYRDVVRGAALMQSHLGYFTRRPAVRAIAEALDQARNLRNRDRHG